MQADDERSATADSSMPRSRRYIPPASAKGVKPAGYWFKQRGYNDPLLDRRTATTTGQMLYQVVDPRPLPVVLQDIPPPTPPSAAAIAANRRREAYSNRFSEHDNRNIIQNYGEYFGRGFGKRLMPHSVEEKPDWMLSHYPLHVPPDRSVTQRDYRGWPALENQQLALMSAKSTSRRKAKHHWMASCYDDWGQTVERVPNELIYRDDYKRMPIHPWHY